MKPAQEKLRTCDLAWEKLWSIFELDNHDFDKEPFYLSSKRIWETTKHFTFGSRTALEPRLLAKYDTRESRPNIFKENNVFIIPIENKLYALVRGEGYLDIPDITTKPILIPTSIDFDIIGSSVGNSEMQHIDFAYAHGLIQHFVQNENIVYSIRGRKRGPEFGFHINNHSFESKSVQMEVDAGFEGKDEIYLFEAKSSSKGVSLQSNLIARQLFYPYRMWSGRGKKVRLFFFEKRLEQNQNIYCFWEFASQNESDYNSLEFVKSAKYLIPESNKKEP